MVSDASPGGCGAQGMPFEVWKTRMGRHRNETTMEAFANVYKRGGIGGFWAGTGAAWER